MRTLSTVRILIPLVILSWGTSTAHAQDAYMKNLSIPRYIKAGTNYPISVTAWNTSSVPYTNVSVSWSLDGGTVHTMTALNIGGGGIVTGSYLPVTCPVQLNTTQGVHTLVVTVNIPSDVNLSNNSLTTEFTALTSWADKVVLLESNTETWCPNCPPSNVTTNGLMNDPDYAVAKFHTSDQFDFPDGITYYNQYGADFTPAGIIDMGEYGGYEINYAYTLWSDEMAARAAGVSPVSVTMHSSLNWSTRALTVTLTAHFLYSFAGPFEMNVYVLEDNLAGPQENAPSGYIHNRVMRAMLGGASGTSGIIPNTPVIGTDYTQAYTYTVPASFKIADLKLIGLVENTLGAGNRYCVNAVKSSASAVGIDELSVANELLDVYPNPFRDAVNIALKGISGKARVEVLSLDGRVIVQRDLMLDGSNAVRLEVGTDLPASLYILRVTTADLVAQKQLMRVD